MNISNDDKTQVKNLLDDQHLAVLATFSGSHPYTNLIAFSSYNQYKELIFATLRNTSKYKNLQKNKNVSVLIDNRDKNPLDFMKFITITALGKVEEVEKNLYKDILLTKHPYLTDFINNDDCALLKITIDQYIIVKEFEDITIFSP
ncbi:MAG: pyridoxamine 5'-phosphate oxidase family protein [Thermoplasmatota archaeon]